MNSILPKAQRYKLPSKKYKWLQPFVNDLAKKYDVHAPIVYTSSFPEINAWSSFFKTNSSYIVITDLALRNMNNNQIKATLGHEIGHNRLDIRFNVIISFIGGLITILLTVMLYMLLGNSTLFWIFLFIMLYLAYILITENTLRHSEFLADRIGARLTSVDDMISTMELFKANEYKPQHNTLINEIRNKMQLHPSNQDRINKLEKLK